MLVRRALGIRTRRTNSFCLALVGRASGSGHDQRAALQREVRSLPGHPWQGYVSTFFLFYCISVKKNALHAYHATTK